MDPAIYAAVKLYFATYITGEYHPEETRRAIAHLNDQHNAGTLDEVVANCRDNECNADLYDTAGFRKGFVYSDGTYNLT